jgi:leucyl-tRNA synthetase
MRFILNLPLDYGIDEVQKAVLEHKDSVKWLEGNIPKKIIVVPGKIVNVVL